MKVTMATRYMMRAFLLGAFVSLVSLPAAMRGQGMDDGHTGHSTYTCGSDWARQLDEDAINERTRRNHPELYERMVAEANEKKDGRAILSSSVSTGGGITGDFWLVNRTTGEREKVPAISCYIGDNMIIWVAIEDTGKIAPATVDALVVGMEERVNPGPNTRNVDAGVRENDIAIFGSPPFDLWAQAEDFIHLLLLDIDDGNLTGGTLSGYFYPVDQDPDALGSNQRNLLYIDSPKLYSGSKSAINNVLGTIAHEFQHLINHGRYPRPVVASDVETHWIFNEGLSEVASLRNGYQDRTALQTMSNPNRFGYFDAPIGATTGDTILPGYERGMLLTHYLSEQYGDGFLYQLVAQPGRFLEPVQAALDATGNSRTADQTFTQFWVANYLQNAGDAGTEPQFRYSYSIGGRSATTTTMTFPDATTTESSNVKGYAAVLPRYANSNNSESRGLNVRFHADGNNYGVHAVIFRDDGSIGVIPMTVEEDYPFVRFDDIVFIVASLHGDAQTIRWTVEKTTLGVDDYNTSADNLRITQASPNPVSGEARVEFTTRRPGSVLLQLYDIRGKMVKSLLDGEPRESGSHAVTFDASELEPGVYTIRLADESGEMSIRQIVVID